MAALKDQNRLGLWTVAAANLAVFALLAKPNLSAGADPIEIVKSWAPLLPAGLGLILVGIVNGQVDGLTKAKLVFFRLKDPLPGREAFTKIGPSDDRVDMAVLAKRFGPLPTAPKDQNALWYRIFKSVEADPAVEHAHREYLFTRDYTFLAALMLVGLSALSFFMFDGAPKAFAYVAVLTLQFLITGQAARVHGRRLVSTVLAVASAKEI